LAFISITCLPLLNCLPLYLICITICFNLGLLIFSELFYLILFQIPLFDSLIFSSHKEDEIRHADLVDEVKELLLRLMDVFFDYETGVGFGVIYLLQDDLLNFRCRYLTLKWRILRPFRLF